MFVDVMNHWFSFMIVSIQTLDFFYVSDNIFCAFCVVRDDLKQSF